MATGIALVVGRPCLNAGGIASKGVCASHGHGGLSRGGLCQVSVGRFDSVLLRAPGLRPLSHACRGAPLGKRRREARRWRASGREASCEPSGADGRTNEQAGASFDQESSASPSAGSNHLHGLPPTQEASTSGQEFRSEGERRHSRRHPWARTAVRWASAILLGGALVMVNTQPAMAAWGFGGRGGVRDAPRPGTVGLTEDQRRKQEEEAAARRAAEEQAARQARAQQEEERAKAREAEQAQQEQRAREGIIEEVEFFRKRNEVTDEWELPLAVYEEAADCDLVDRSLLGWSKDTLRVQLRPELGPIAEPEYLVLIPYTQKKRFLDKYTADVDVAAGVGLGADAPRNLFEELHYEATTGQGRGQNLARRKIDLLIKHIGEYGPFWFLSKERIDPESLGFTDGEAAYLWIEYWVAAGLAATWVWVMFADKDQKTERWGDKRAVKEFRRQFQVAEMKSDVTLRDVAGLEHVVDELQEVITFLKHPQKFEAMGARPPRGMLLYGLPGTGKTLLARAIAGEAGVPLIHVVASKFAMGNPELQLVGVQAAKVRGMFRLAKERAPMVIFLDEIDGLCAKRGGAQEGDIIERERQVTLNQLLVEMDGFNTYANKGILLIGATNNPALLDPAITRPGRMDRIIEMPLPDLPGRVEIMTLYNKGWQFLGPIDLVEIAERGGGLTPADLSDIYEDAIRGKIDRVTTSFRQIVDIYFRKRGPYYFLHPVALIPGPWQRHIPRWFGAIFRRFFAINPEDFQPKEDYCITQADLRRAIDFIALEKQAGRGQTSDRLWAPTIFHTRSFKQPFAAGLVTTAWMAALLPNHPPVLSMWIERYEGESLAVCNIGSWEQMEFVDSATRRMLEKMLVVLASSVVGLRMLLPEDMHDTLLHARDIKHAQRLAREMCASTGFSFDDDATMWAGSIQGEMVAARRIRKTKSPAMGWAKQQELREMGDVLVNIAINKAAEILIPHKEAMEELMERLMVHDRLEKEDIEAHMRKHNVQPVEEFWLTPGGRFSIPEPEGRNFTPGGIVPDPVGTPVDLGPQRLTLTQLGTKYARKYKQIIKRGGYVPADRWNDPELEGKTWLSAPDFATEDVLEVTMEPAVVGQT